MDWFKGKSTGKPPYLMGKSMVSCKFCLKPIQSYAPRRSGVKSITHTAEAFAALKDWSILVGHWTDMAGSFGIGKYTLWL